MPRLALLTCNKCEGEPIKVQRDSLQENQQVVFISDGGENVRRVQEYLQPFSEHLIEWFHITMRLTVLQQRTAKER